MLSRIVFVVLILVVLAGCQSGVDTADLSEAELKNLQFVDQQNVAMYGGPPLIPVDHEIIIGEDVDHFSNGGQDCLDCHYDESEEEATQTTHPERYNCLQCHLPQPEDEKLAEDFQVENAFVKYAPATAK